MATKEKRKDACGRPSHSSRSNLSIVKFFTPIPMNKISSFFHKSRKSSTKILISKDNIFNLTNNCFMSHKSVHKKQSIFSSLLHCLMWVRCPISWFTELWTGAACSCLEPSYCLLQYQAHPHARNYYRIHSKGPWNNINNTWTWIINCWELIIINSAIELWV